jgi:hypothetical protein
LEGDTKLSEVPTQSTATLLLDAAKNKLRLDIADGIADGDDAALLDGAVLEAAFELAVKRAFSLSDDIPSHQ